MSTDAPTSDEVNAAIRRFRLARGLSQAELADRAGVDRKTINRLENGQHSPSVSSFLSISAALDVHPAELLKAAAEIDVDSSE